MVCEAKDKSICTSLAVFKPSKIKSFNYKSVSRHWNPKILAKLEAKARQQNLFQNSENPFKVVKKLPFQFSFTFEDDEGRESSMMIEDWEIGQLYWNMFYKYGNEEQACKKVKMKYYDDFALTKELYFYLGTLSRWHFVSPQPFVIIGTFHPPFDNSPQLSLF